MALPALPKLPPLLQQKFTKTGYTRGATQREIYQNRVTRNNTVLIPLAQWEQCRPRGDGTPLYEKGYIVLVDPSWYFPKPDAEERLKEKDLELGHNALLLYQNRADWESFGPPQIALHSGPALTVASSRTSPLCGNYFARIHATVADDVGSLVEGYCSSSLRGAGIRVYEYASSSTLRDTRLQLECLFWRCYDYAEVLAATTMNQHRRDAPRRTSIPVIQLRLGTSSLQCCSERCRYTGDTGLDEGCARRTGDDRHSGSSVNGSCGVCRSI